MAQRTQAESHFLVGTILLLGFLTFLIFRPFLDWVILGFLFSYMFYGMFRRMTRVVRRRSIAAGIMLVLILAAFFVPIVLVAAVLVRDATRFAGQIANFGIEGTLASLIQSVAVSLGLQVDPANAQAYAGTIVATAQARATEFLTHFAEGLPVLIGNLMLGFFIFGFTVYYGFVDGERFVAAIRRAIPLREQEKAHLLAEVQTVTNAVFIGHLLIAFIQAILGTLGFWILGVPDAFFWGFVMLILAIVPVVGPFLVWIPIGLVLLFVDAPVNGLLSDNPRFAGLGVLLVVGPIVSTIDNVLRPKLVGSRADIHPFLVLIGALGGLFVLGFTGFVVGPLVLALFVATVRVYRRHWTGGHEPTPTRASAEKSKRARRARANQK